MSLSNITESFQKEKIQQLFKDNLIPTASSFYTMIDNTLNRGSNTPLTGSYNHQHLRGQLNMSRGFVNYKRDEFHETCPPFVPNLHPYIKTFALDGDSIMYQSASVGISNIGSNEGIWEFTYGNGAGSQDIRANNVDNGANGGDFKFGSFQFRTSATANNVASIITAPKAFSCKTNKPWWVKTRFRINDYNNTKWFFGLDEEQGNEANDSATLVSTGASKDKVGFFHLNNTTSIKGIVSKNTNASTNITFESASVDTVGGKDHANYENDSDVLSLGLHWNGTNSIKFYMDRAPSASGSANLHHVHTFNTTANIPNDSNLRLVFKLKTMENNFQQINFECLQGAVTRA